MLSNRLAIIFLLTRRANVHGLGISEISVEDEIGSNSSSDFSDNIDDDIENLSHRPVITSQFPYTPYHKVMLNYDKYSVSKSISQTPTNLSFATILSYPLNKKSSTVT